MNTADDILGIQSPHLQSCRSLRMKARAPNISNGVTMTHYVGIDVTKATLEVAEECTGKSQRYPNTAEGRDKLLKALIAHDGHVQVVLEPTSTYHQHIVDGDMIESGVWRG